MTNKLMSDRRLLPDMLALGLYLDIRTFVLSDDGNVLVSTFFLVISFLMMEVLFRLNGAYRRIVFRDEVETTKYNHNLEVFFVLGCLYFVSLKVFNDSLINMFIGAFYYLFSLYFCSKKIVRFNP